MLPSSTYTKTSSLCLCAGTTSPGARMTFSIKPSCPGTSGSYQDMTTSDSLVLLSNANIRYGDLLEKVRRSYRAWRIRLQRVAKFRPAERLPEVCHRLPDRIVDEHSASADTAVQLSRDESGL